MIEAATRTKIIVFQRKTTKSGIMYNVQNTIKMVRYIKSGGNMTHSQENKVNRNQPQCGSNV